MITIYIYSHLPKSYTYDILSLKFTDVIADLKIIDVQDIISKNINAETDILFVYEPQKNTDLQFLINLTTNFKKENTFIFFYENVIDTKSHHKWKNNVQLLNSFGRVFSPNYRVCDNKHYNWIPSHHTILNYCMINIEYFKSYKLNRLSSYSGIKYDVINNKNIDNCLEGVNIIKEYHNKSKFIACQPISGAVDDYRINIIKNVSQYCDIDTYGFHGKLKFLKNYKGCICSNNIDIYSNRRYRSVSTIETLSNYKFNLILENECIDGYFSERFIDGLCSYSIPVYFGPKNPEKFFPELFENVINGYSFNNIEELIYFIKNMSIDEYNKRINYINTNLNKYLLLFSQDNLMNYMIYKILGKELDNDNLLYLNKINIKNIM